MKNLVAAFSEQLLEAIDIIKDNKKIKPSAAINTIVISGLGGSGIGGTAVKDYLNNIKLPLPVVVNSDYSIPAFVNKNTLFIVCSYSGDTEETLEALKNAQKQGAQIACITSGGTLEKLAIKNKYTLTKIPAGFPPRSMFAYSFTAILGLLNQYGIIINKFENEILAAVGLLTELEANTIKQAKIVAKKLLGNHVYLYSISGNEASIIRFRQQLNENAKILASHHIIPEMNHNELAGWTKKGDYAIVIFRTATDHKRNQKRIEIIKPVLKKYAKSIIEINAEGNNFIERFLYLVHLGDWISVELASLRGIDAVEVNIINYLKNNLAKS